jgi:hypothetical protein
MRSWLRNTLIVAAGVISGAVMGVYGLALTGASHGWLTGATVTMLGMVTAPLTALVWIGRRTWTGRVVALLLVLFALLMDFDVLLEWHLGTDGPYRVWNADAGDVVVSVALVLIWQALPVGIVVMGAKDLWARRSQPKASAMPAR